MQWRTTRTTWLRRFHAGQFVPQLPALLVNDSIEGCRNGCTSCPPSITVIVLAALSGLRKYIPMLRRYKTLTWIKETENWRSNLAQSHHEMPLQECAHASVRKTFIILTFNMDKLLLCLHLL